jgi:hypothetical protein
MPSKKKTPTRIASERLAALATQGRTWRFVDEVAKFERPRVLLDPPMEITPAMIRGLRMVDETVVVHGRPTQLSTGRETDKGGER